MHRDSRLFETELPRWKLIAHVCGGMRVIGGVLKFVNWICVSLVPGSLLNDLHAGSGLNSFISMSAIGFDRTEKRAIGVTSRSLNVLVHCLSTMINADKPLMYRKEALPVLPLHKLRSKQSDVNRARREARTSRQLTNTGGDIAEDEIQPAFPSGSGLISADKKLAKTRTVSVGCVVFAMEEKTVKQEVVALSFQIETLFPGEVGSEGEHSKYCGWPRRRDSSIDCSCWQCNPYGENCACTNCLSYKKATWGVRRVKYPWICERDGWLNPTLFGRTASIMPLVGRAGGSCYERGFRPVALRTGAEQNTLASTP